MLLPTAALSLHPQCNPHNRLISAANVEQIFQITKFLAIGSPLVTRPCSASAISVAA